MSHFHNTVFGFSNADAYKDGVAIRDLSLQTDLALVREWIQLCNETHANSNFSCLPKDGIPLQGFTVIDCKDGRNILVPGTTCMEYITLSYVWGSEVSEGPDQFGKLPSTLPDLITDVIKVVIALGYRYLWIDRYCVPQDDSSDVKPLLIKNMDKIYSQSTLTIIATTSKRPSEGLPGVTKPRIPVQKFLQVNSVHLVQWVSNIQHEIDNSVWNTRGWTYQEALFSRRKLVFTETRCYFQCDAGGTRSGKGGSRMEIIDYDLTTERQYPDNYHIPVIFRPRPKHCIDWP
ncbi:putative het-domain-containing protein [Botrytis fragariae]|uniref:Putative het-domain-containing protein n=1 Tax=Botrytis fragariae TaxID=1964551 RepID=A0A8H6AUA6_9HELO|nr:putative het-domain-containing protein [Botrytis fragariae]KAF5873923.1 putative het-domain-containing protein [Botrytis fragariae]